MKAPRSMKPGFVACAWCAEPTLLSTAIGPRQKMGVCPACFKNYRPPTEAQRGRVEAIVRAEYKSATGVTIEPRSAVAVEIASKLVDAGYCDASDDLLHKVARRAIYATPRAGGVA